MSEDVVVTRELNVPRERVVHAWTDAKSWQQWWGPKGFTNPRCEVDARPGGAIRVDMRAPDGSVHAMGGQFREVTAGRIVFVTSALDASGKPMFEFLHEITFCEYGDKTTMMTKSRLTSSNPGTEPMTSGFRMGWSQQMDRLEEYLR